MGDAWTIVGGDPAPGDPNWTRRVSAVLAELGDEARTSHAQLSAVGSQCDATQWSGPAADVFRARLGTVLPDLAKAGDSYAAAGEALAAYASALEAQQEAAQRTLTQALAAQSAAQEAEAEAQSARSALAVLQMRAEELRSQVALISSELTAREQQLGAQAAADPLVQEWNQQLQTLEGSLAAVEGEMQQAQERLYSANADAAHAGQGLDAARSEADAIRYDVRRAASSSEAALRHAAAEGIRNVSFWQRDFHVVESTMGRLSSHALRDAQRFATDAGLAASGNLGGLRDLAGWAAHDIVAEAPEIHAITHALDRVVHDVAVVVRAVAPVLEVACIIAAVVQPELIPLAAAALAAIPRATDAVDAASVALDDAELGSDELMALDGQAGRVDMAQDAATVESDVVTTFVDVAGDGLNVPDGGAAASFTLLGDPTDAMDAIELTVVWSRVTAFDEQALGL